MSCDGVLVAMANSCCSHGYQDLSANGKCEVKGLDLDRFTDGVKSDSSNFHA
jgi:hypothetical protein